VTVHCGAYRNKLAVGNFGSTKKKKINVVLTREFCNLSFLCRGEFLLGFSMLFHFVSLANWKKTLFTSYNFLQQFKIFVNKPDESATFSTRCSHCSAIKEWGKILAESCSFYKFLPRICLAASLPTPRLSARSLMLIRLSYLTFAWGLSIHSLNWTETLRPRRRSCSSYFLLPWKRANHWDTCARLRRSSRTHFSGIGTTG
jgi:hypothetical protein